LRQVALLDPLVAQRVAAGAVLDRLTSGVKELSGNTLDADVARTEVELVDSRNALIVLEEADKLPAYPAGIWCL
jgi:DNA mismatch repair ATPase MutL